MPAFQEETVRKPLLSYGQALDTSPEAFGWLRETRPGEYGIDEVRRRLEEDGYLFLRGMTDRETVLEARTEALSRLAESGTVDERFPLIDGVANPEKKSRLAPEAAKENAALQRVLYTGPVISFFEALWSEPVRHFDYTWFRAISPGRGTYPHCDIVYMGRGTHRLMTMWTPLGDVTIDIGGLIILEGSHLKGDRIRRYLERDVDTFCSNRKDASSYASGEKTWNGALSLNPVTLRNFLGGRWLTAREYRMGDVVIFPMNTVHGSLDNQSDRIRLSSDSRYQPAGEPADERWVGANPIAHGRAGKRGRVC